MLALAFAASVAWPVAAQIFRCTAAGGEVTYQESPCGSSEVARVMDLPASYPEVDASVRMQLLERAAEVDRRLEARRERESRESIAAMQARAGAETAAAPPSAEPVYLYAWPRLPARVGPRGHARPTRAL